MKISMILDQIDLSAMALPVFQRGYVWNRDQVRGLMKSLYRRYPVGSLIVWSTKTEHAKVRGVVFDRVILSLRMIDTNVAGLRGRNQEMYFTIGMPIVPIDLQPSILSDRGN